MDNFFKGVDADLVRTIEEVIPDTTLNTIVQDYDGSNTKEGHLRALIPELSATADAKSKSVEGDSESLKKADAALALVHAALDDWPAAERIWQRVVETDDKVSSEDHPRRDLAAIFNLGLAQNHLKHYSAAEQTFKRLLPMLETAPRLGKTSQQYAGCLSALMLAVGKQGQVDEARKLYSEHAATIKDYEGEVYSAHANTAKAVLTEIEHDAREQ